MKEVGQRVGHRLCLWRQETMSLHAAGGGFRDGISPGSSTSWPLRPVQVEPTGCLRRARAVLRGGGF